MASCEERIDKVLKSTIEDLETLWLAYTNAGGPCPQCEQDNPDSECPICGGSGEIDEDGNTPELGNWFEYGLGFWYDEAGGYFCYQLSTGGPGDEFRFFASPGRGQWHLHSIEYWFLDWWDGAHRNITGQDAALLNAIFDWFDEVGVCQSEFEKAVD